MRAGASRTGAIAGAWMLVATLAVPGGVVHAGKADVVDVRVEREGDRVYRFTVTVRHADEGWDHYADRWEVRTPGGEVLDTRVLHHPHENEQPFTRSLRGVEIPAGVGRVVVRARDSVHGYGGVEQGVEVP